MSITRDTRPVDPDDHARREQLHSLAKTLREIHSALLNSVKRDYEVTHGKVEGPLKLYQLVTNDPFFSWLRPLSGQMALLDERIDDKTKLVQSDLDGVKKIIEDLFAAKKPKAESFTANYRARVQSDGSVAALHPQLLEHLQELAAK
jgi:hypothetical protein